MCMCMCMSMSMCMCMSMSMCMSGQSSPMHQAVSRVTIGKVSECSVDYL